MDETELKTYRLERVEKDLKDIRDEIHNQYLNKYQLMTEYITRLENEKTIERASRNKREWPVIAGAVVVAFASLGSLILQAIGH